jgi:hypothetical protein
MTIVPDVGAKGLMLGTYESVARLKVDDGSVAGLTSKINMTTMMNDLSRIESFPPLLRLRFM